MAVRSRLIYGVASQGAASLSNLLLVLTLANTQTPVTVGQWSLAFAVLTLATTLARAAISTPVVLAGASDPARDVRGGFTLTVLASAVTATVLMLLALAGVTPTAIAAGVALSAFVALPQDFLRYSWIARGKPRNALVLDTIWLLAQVVATGFYLLAQGTSAVVITLLWGSGALAATLVGITLDPHARLSVQGARKYLAAHQTDARRLFGESLAVSLSISLQPFVVGALAGLAATGALRVAQSLFAPLTTLVAGLSPVVLRELSARFAANRSTKKVELSWQLGLGALNLAYGAVLLLLPTSIGEGLTGSTWSLVSVLLLPLAVQALLRPPLTISTLSLRARRRLSLLQTSSWAFLIPSALLPGICALAWGLQGVGWGLVIDSAVRTAFYWSVNRASR